jgi:serine O-acetyltransferase
MITNKEDLRYYLICDEYARFGEKVSIFRKLRLGAMWSFQVCLRKSEYYENTKKDVLKNCMTFFYRWKLKQLGMKLGWSIYPNTFGPGMCIVHYGTVVVNGGARIGCNCRIHAGVNIGANGGGDEDTPRIGDKVYIGPGAKLFGKIEIGDNSVIGANSVVNKDFKEGGYTIGGIPARVISIGDSSRFIKNLPIFEAKYLRGD